MTSGNRGRVSPKTMQLVKRKILMTGATIQSVASSLKMSWHKVSRIVNQLVDDGELIVVSSTKNLKIYEDGRKSVNLAVMCEQPVAENIDNSCDKYIPPRTWSGNESICDHSPKTVRVHASGCYQCKIKRGGATPKIIRDDDGYTIGKWDEDPTILKSKASYYNGFIRVGKEDLKFKAHRDKNNQWTKLLIFPRPRYLYYKTAVQESQSAMLTQCDIVTRVLAKDGWELSMPEHLGVMHYGDLNPQLLIHADFKKDFEKGRIHADHSPTGGDAPNEGELEIYGDSETAQHDIDLIVELPERIDRIESTLEKHSKILDKLVENQEKLTSVLVQQQDNIMKLTESINKLTEITEKQTSGLVKTSYGSAYA